MRAIRDVVVVLAVLAGLVVWQTGLGRDRIGTEPVHTPALRADEEGRILTVVLREVPVWHTAVGSVASRVRSEISARVMAAVTSVAVDVGDPVVPETPLVVLDDRDLRARVEAAGAALSAAEARRTQAVQALERVQRLVASGAATKADLEVAEADHAAAAARVRSAREVVTEATVALGHTSIASPVEGVVVERLADPGDLALPGRPLLVVHDPRDLRLEVRVPARLAGALSEGDPVTVRFDAVDAELETTIEEVVPSVDPRTRSVLVRAALDRREGVRPGQSARLLFRVGTRNVLAVPRDIVGTDGTVRIRGEDGTLRLQAVRLGRTCQDGVTAEVLAGLSEGDVVWVPATANRSGSAEPDGSDSGVPVETRREELWSEAVGIVASRTVTSLSARVMARIRSIAVREGDPVSAEQEVARLEDRDLRARLDAARASLAEADARLLQAEQALRRTKGLLARGAATREGLEAAEADARAARAMRSAATERVREADVGLGFARIVSPVSGVVVERLAEPGDLAGPGRPILVVHDPTHLRFEAAVPERLASRLGVGVAVRVEIGDEVHETRIDEVVPASDPTTRTVLVKAPLPSDRGLHPGRFGRLAFRSGERTALLVPTAAVRRVGQLELVRAVAPDGSPRVRSVRTRPRDADHVEVLSGLTAGERVLVEGR